MGARFFAKRMKRLHWTLDDTLLLGALVFMYITFAGAIVAVTVGKVGYHMSTLTQDDLEVTFMILWVLQFPHAIGLTLVRWAIVVFFMRTFFTHMFPRLRRAAFSCLVLSIAWALTVGIINLIHCRPIRHSWLLPIESPRYCFSLKPYTIFQATFGLVLDGVIWSLPHFVVWKLQLRRAHQIAITVIFALGLLNILVATFWITSLYYVEYSGDVTYDTMPAAIWAFSQVSTAILLACCPLLRPVFEKLVPARLTRVRTPSVVRPARRISVRNVSNIRVTTRIDVHNNSSRPHDGYRGCFHDGHAEPYGPTFDVEMGEKFESRSASCSPCP
ncbi:hypothetical protein K458DRAFT_384164 [Lentithecium fluviatile CBS 122367]|uniref:Rhodopsin domain-containing protein n=1 Tax=Lentithecium fluviatile CBS 122367 TaxID=1168545 RepID=A0A6G1JGD1_9PLEO|nr:hypothetical protein K458DRAFT_384164 [Lentithecium fluviatile CBS 122367]